MTVLFHGQAIMKNLPPSEMIESCSVAGPGFVNVVLSKNWMAKVFFFPPKDLLNFIYNVDLFYLI